MVSKPRPKGNKKKTAVLVENFTKKKRCQMRKLWCLTAVICSIVLFTGVCYPDEEKTIRKYTEVVTIKPNRFHEKCLTLTKRQVFEYSFNSSGPVYFNIHYHGEYGREYMIEKKEISAFKGKLTEFQYKKAYKGFSKKANLCMLWRNNTEGPVEVSIDCTISKQ
jgi:hypothetical protein